MDFNTNTMVANYCYRYSSKVAMKEERPRVLEQLSLVGDIIIIH